MPTPMNPMPMPMNRRLFATLPAVFLLGLASPSHAEDALRIDASRGTIDFTVGNSAFFRTSGVFRKWQGTVRIDEANIPASQVRVTIDMTSADTRDAQQDSQLRGPDFFDVARYPSMSFTSTSVQRLSQQKLRVTGDVTLRGVTRPMVLDVDVLDHKPGSAKFTATGRVKRADFGMNKYLDITGEFVDIKIKADAVR